MRKLVLLIACLTAVPSAAHVGSPNVFFDGEAGPYPVRVVVRPPEVVPGLAEITVRIREGEARRVTARPIQWKAGTRGAPPPDVAEPVSGAGDLFTVQLWVMVQSSYAVEVHVEGEDGLGTVLVPVAVLPSRVRDMQPGMGAILAGLGLFLFLGAVTIVGAAVRESTLDPGEIPDEGRQGRARIVTVTAAVLLALALYGGKVWWDSVDARARAGIYKPFEVETAARLDAGRQVLRLAIADERRRDWSPLMPDHGKLVHLFLLREPGLDAFAHVHPVPRGEDAFEAALPPLPAGTYRLYADVVHESGFPQTLVDTVEIPAPGTPGAGAPEPDPDDSWRQAPPLPSAFAAGPRMSVLEDGSTMLWHQAPLAAGRETDLRFEVRSPKGIPSPWSPTWGC
jgi:hypothetical protein